MKEKLKKIIRGAMLGAAVSGLAFVSIASAATSTVKVTPLNNQGWVFNGDPVNATPYEFTDDQSSIGEGSLYVEPIGPNPAHKFIALKTLGTPVSHLSSISYDFLIAGNGDDADANQFYLNVYTNLPGSTTFYDCRFDYIPASGSTTHFTTAAFDSTDTPVNVDDRFDGTPRPDDGYNCPATLDQMTPGSTVKFIAINVGDTTTSDVGLAGYLDNIIVNTIAGGTIYDLEPVVTLSDKEACKNGGWEASNNPSFKNQGECVSSFASKSKNASLAHYAFGSVTLSDPVQQLNFSAVDNGLSALDTGAISYSNPSALLSYSATPTCVGVSGDTATFAYVIPDGNPFAGTWVVWKVVDGVTDTAGFVSAADMASANALCESGSFTPANYTITSGNLAVN